jgi:hypothetical protein
MFYTDQHQRDQHIKFMSAQVRSPQVRLGLKVSSPPLIPLQNNNSRNDNHKNNNNNNNSSDNNYIHERAGFAAFAQAQESS